VRSKSYSLARTPRVSSGNLAKLAMKGAATAWRNRKTIQKYGKKLFRKGRQMLGKRTSASVRTTEHAGKDESKHYISLGKKKKRGKGLFTYTQQNAQLWTTSTTGKQVLGTVAIDLTSDQIFNQASDPEPNFMRYQRGLSYYSPSLRATGDAAGLISATTPVLNTKLLVHNIKYDIQFVNGASTATDVILYVVTPRKGGVGSQWTSAGLGLTQSAGCLTDYGHLISTMPSSINAVNASDTSGVQVQAVIGKPSGDMLGFTPWQLPGFRKLYKLLLVKNVSLGGGSIHKFAINVAVNALFDLDVVSDQANHGSDALANRTIQIFAIAKGSPVIVREADGTFPIQDNARVTSSIVEVGVTCVRKITGSFMSQVSDAKIDYIMPTFRTVGLGGTTVTKIVDVEDDSTSPVFA